MTSSVYRDSRLTVKVRQAETAGLVTLLRLGLCRSVSSVWTWSESLLVVPPANARFRIRLVVIRLEVISYMICVDTIVAPLDFVLVSMSTGLLKGVSTVVYRLLSGVNFSRLASRLWPTGVFLYFVDWLDMNRL